jgi:hypothetical protein
VIADVRVPGYLGRVLDGSGAPVGTCFQVAVGVLVTAWHVLDDLHCGEVGAEVTVDALADGVESGPARVARIDRTHDLAVLTTEVRLSAVVAGLTVSDGVPMSADVVVAGVSKVPDGDRQYRWLLADGKWKVGTVRDDHLPLGRLTAGDLQRGMSGAPVCRAGDGVVVGVVSSRYNSPDDWQHHTVWAARVENLLPLLVGKGSDLVLHVGPSETQPGTVPPPEAPPGTGFRALRAAVASSGDGILCLYVVTTTGKLLRSTYREPGRWSPWRDLEVDTEAVDVAATSTLQVFYADASGQVWSATDVPDRPVHWVRVDGNPGVGRVVALTAVAGWPQHREIYVVGEHGAVAHGWKWHEGIWEWRPADVPVPCRDVALSAGTPDLLECFAVGRDQRIRHRWFWTPDEKWTEWATGAGEDAPGKIIALDVLNGWVDHQEIFTVRTDGEINHRDHWRGHDWRPWRDLEVPTKMSDVAAGITSEGRLEVIAIARDGELWQRSYDEQRWWSQQWRRVPTSEVE